MDQENNNSRAGRTVTVCWQDYEFPVAIIGIGESPAIPVKATETICSDDLIHYLLGSVRPR